MTYIATDNSLDIKHGTLTETPLRGSSARYVCNPIVDDIEARPDSKEEYQPPSCRVVGDPSINDLASKRWQGRTVDAETGRELIRRIQEGDPLCRAGQPRGCSCRKCLAFYDPRPNTVSLLPAFHHSIRAIANEYVPKRSERRQYKKDLPPTEHDRGKRKVPASDSLIFQDLMAVGCLGLWKSTLAFDFDRGCRLWTIAQPKIEGWISREANYLRQGGYTSGDTVARYTHKKVGRRTQTRLDRWIFDHLSAPPEELLEAQEKLGLKRRVFHSLEEAAEPLKLANNLEHSEVYLDDGEDGSGDIPETAATEPSQEFRALYDSYNRPQLDQLPDERRDVVDLYIDRLVYCLFVPPRKKPKVFARKPYDPDRRVVRAVKMKDGTTRRLYCQMATGRGRHIKVTAKLNAKYVAMIQPNEPKRKRNVRTKPKQAASGPIADVIVFESRRGRPQRFHVCQQCNPPRIGDRFTCARITG